MPVKQQENSAKASKKIFQNTTKPRGNSFLSILVYTVLLESPYALTVKKVQQIIASRGFGVVNHRGIQSAINNIYTCADQSECITLAILENQHAGRSRAMAFSLTVNNQKSHTNA